MTSEEINEEIGNLLTEIANQRAALMSFAGWCIDRAVEGLSEDRPYDSDALEQHARGELSDDGLFKAVHDNYKFENDGTEASCAAYWAVVSAQAVADVSEYPPGHWEVIEAEKLAQLIHLREMLSCQA